jgi:tetratricopeptide (TPR) repeat protein
MVERLMKSKTHFFALIALSLFSFSPGVYSQSGEGQAGSFLRYGVGGRALGMGRSFVAVADDASGVYWNPAGIVGAKRMELASMYSNLFYDSQFAYFGLVVPRMCDSTGSAITRFFFGPATAWGFGWVGLSTSGFEQRNSTGRLLGDFGFSENAFIMSWAREEVGSWGVFRYGVNLKYVGQNFTGLQASSEMGISDQNQAWSPGMDVGLTFQPIHAPLFRAVSLRYLLPLRFGLSVQNVVQPQWNITGNHRDVFPVVVRFGVSYRWILRDWIPETWEGVRDLLGDCQILTVMDKEWYRENESGNYLGAEIFLPITESGVAVYPRFGLNNRADGKSLGLGVTLPFTNSAMLRVDYAYGFHDIMPADNRFFISLEMGREKGADYFQDMAEREGIEDSERQDYLLRVLSEYPNDEIESAVSRLIDMADSTRIRRYIELKGGLERAEWFFDEAKELLVTGNISKAKRRGEDAARDYERIFIKKDHSLTEDNLLNFGEALLIAQRPEDALTVLQEVQPNMRYYYLMGVGKKSVGDYEGAVEMFQNVIKELEHIDTQTLIDDPGRSSMITLSFLGQAESFVLTGKYYTAITALETILDKFRGPLDPGYPRYPVFSDDAIVDDAQFLKAICRLKVDPGPESVQEFMQTLRFYPGLEYGLYVEEQAENILNVLQAADWDRLSRLADQWLDVYFQRHQWPGQ